MRQFSSEWTWIIPYKVIKICFLQSVGQYEAQESGTLMSRDLEELLAGLCFCSSWTGYYIYISVWTHLLIFSYQKWMYGNCIVTQSVKKIKKTIFNNNNNKIKINRFVKLKCFLNVTYLVFKNIFIICPCCTEIWKWNISVGSGLIMYISNMYFHSKIKVTYEVIAVL